MLIVAGTITVDPDDVDKLRAAATVMMAATLDETGCHQYVFSEHLSEPGTIQIFEMWQSADELNAHFETPHMGTFRRVLGELTVHSRDVYKYDVANMSKM